MTSRKLKKPILYGLYGLAFVALLTTIYVIGTATNSLTATNPDLDYVTKTIFDKNVPVVGTQTTIIRPYADSEIAILKDFYDYQAEADKQEQSLILSENTYMQSTGVSYGGKEGFDVVAILDGTVSSVKEDALLGMVIEITHGNDIISIYQSLSEVAVKQDDKVIQGQIIGKSGNSNIDKELSSHVYFELIIKGQIVNPELYFDKKLSEI